LRPSSTDCTSSARSTTGVTFSRGFFIVWLSVVSRVRRLSDSRDNLKDLVDTLSDKVSDAKGNADDLQQKIQDVKYEEHDKLETARIGY
jgi:hypothetical protein